MIALSSQPPSLLRLLPIAATARLSAIRNPAHLIVNDYPCNLRDSRNFQIGAQPDRRLPRSRFRSRFLLRLIPVPSRVTFTSSFASRKTIVLLCVALVGKMELWSLFADESKKTRTGN